jgi:hypothetical protein
MIDNSGSAGIARMKARKMRKNTTKLYWDARAMTMMRQLLHLLFHRNKNNNNNNNNFSITLLCYY